VAAPEFFERHDLRMAVDANRASPGGSIFHLHISLPDIRNCHFRSPSGLVQVGDVPAQRPSLPSVTNSDSLARIAIQGETFSENQVRQYAIRVTRWFGECGNAVCDHRRFDF
jgi:hypothetical protein